MTREKFVTDEYWEVSENNFATTIENWDPTVPISIAQVILMRYQMEGFDPPAEIYVDDVLFHLEHGCYEEEQEIVNEDEEECEDGPYYDRDENEAHGYFYDAGTPQWEQDDEDDEDDMDY